MVFYDVDIDTILDDLRKQVRNPINGWEYITKRYDLAFPNFSGAGVRYIPQLDIALPQTNFSLSAPQQVNSVWVGQWSYLVTVDAAPFIVDRGFAMRFLSAQPDGNYFTHDLNLGRTTAMSLGAQFTEKTLPVLSNARFEMPDFIPITHVGVTCDGTFTPPTDGGFNCKITFRGIRVQTTFPV